MIINNLEWKVVFDNNLKEDLHGTTNYETLTIYIRSQCVSDNIKRTLMHEIVHAYCYSYGLVFNENYDREQLCEFIAHNIFNLTELFDIAYKELYGIEKGNL